MPTLKEHLEHRLDRRVPNEELAVALGVSLSTVKRRTSEGWPAEDVIRICRALHASPVDALVACDYLTASEVEDAAGGSDVALAHFTDVELAEEILRRAETSATLSAPIDHRPTDPDYVLAALDRDDDAEVEAQQQEP
jgi:hypothetical protein